MSKPEIKIWEPQSGAYQVLDPERTSVRFTLNGEHLDLTLIEDDGDHYLRLSGGMFKMLRFQPLAGNEALISVVRGK